MNNTEEPHHQKDKAIRTRTGKGRYERNQTTADRDAECARLRARSLGYRQIAEQLGISVSQAHDGVARALRDTLQEPADQVRKMELEKLDALERAALTVLETDHQIVFQGELTGIVDDGPRLNAITTLLKVSESRRKLLGLDAATKAEQAVTVQYTIQGIPEEDMP